MANYYEPTVVEQTIPASAMMPIERLILENTFSFEGTDDALYFYAEDQINDYISLDVGEVRTALDANSDPTSTAFKRVLDEFAQEIQSEDDIDIDTSDRWWTEIFQDIIRRSPDFDHISIYSAFTCGKMRPDGFGGMARLITASSVRAKSTNNLLQDFIEEAVAAGEMADPCS